VQADLASHLHVSITPVREALRDLTTEGLVRFDPHRGAVVREVSLEEVREVYELRRLLEPVAAERAVRRIVQARLQSAAELLEEMEGERDPGRWVERNRLFHQVLLDAAGPSRLSSIVGALQDAATLYVAFSVKLDPIRLATGNREHRAILDAFRRRDPVGAQRAVITHLDSTVGSIEAVAAGESGSGSPNSR